MIYQIRIKQRDKKIITNQGIERLKSNIIGMNSGRAVKTMMITSSVKGEGCSTVASYLAATIAKRKTANVILVDGNFRDPSLHKFFNLENKRGLIDFFLGVESVNDIIKRTTLPNLSVIPSGVCDLGLAGLFEQAKIRELLTELKGRFNFLIFDSAPVNNYFDAQILAPEVDGVVIVVQAGKTRWEVAKKAKEQLETAHANLLGVVLNKRKYVIPKFIYKRL